MAEAWANEQLLPQLKQLMETDPQAIMASLPFLVERIGRVAKDAAEIHPHDDEEAAMEWMRETAKAQGLSDMSPVIEELHRQAYREQQ
jgi:hypothetical protein